MLRSPRSRAAFRRVLGLAAIACYTGIALVGYGLHDLVGVHHCHHAAEHIAPGHACSAHAGHEHAIPPEGDSSIASSCDDCAICGLLAQAQSSVTLAAPLGVFVPLATAPDLTEALIFTLRVESSLARGPPTV